ncbi:thiamine phosphate synthase [Sphingobacterium sp. UT-1RO-CII-1]|uniref:thiamine phosphate synthase n=1 Tax=Sphingobacterium sp. UT-1RO-CII-1 TaxID=2995225 RepID=UPI00227BEA6A|nr:thiamine phosphate synthase [Sphingobacterium sp. UT-1RO-CII-1]MCY4781400.1 thiamine phosphate synthase [Sphingobacterium sp. UT-1RO-CII-1]
MINERLQYISSGNTSAEQYENIENALKNGTSWIQIRFKKTDDATFLNLAEDVKKLKKTYCFKLIINDKVHIAQKMDADGVHLGRGDMPISEARILLGKNKIIGGTANTLHEVVQHINNGCNYIGLGPLRFTLSKEHISPTLGYEGYKNICQQIKRQSNIPIYAIGGIVENDIPKLIEAGVYGVALSKHIEENFKHKNHINNLKKHFK